MTRQDQIVLEYVRSHRRCTLRDLTLGTGICKSHAEVIVQRLVGARRLVDLQPNEDSESVRYVAVVKEEAST